MIRSLTMNIATAAAFAALMLASAEVSSAPDAGSPDAFLPAVTRTETSPTLERGGHSIPLRPEMLSREDLPVAIPQTTRTTLPNGVRLFTLPSHDVPGLYYTVLLKAGSVLDPGDKVGLAELTASALRAGGTESLTPDEFDLRLDEIGSQLSISAERQMVRIEMFALSAKRAEALQLLTDLLLKPAFAERQFEQRKAQRLEEIRRENDQPGDVARREFRRLVYGGDHPLGRVPTTSTVSAITLADVRRFHEEYYAPSACWFGVAGDMTTTEAEEMVRARLGEWRKPAPPVAAMPDPVDAGTSRPAIVLIPRRSAQSHLRLGHLTIPRNHPLQPAAEVMSSIYGMSGFSSRLLTEVRTKRGYAYAVGGGVQVDDPRGVFFAAASSKAASTCSALQAMLDVTTSTATGDFTEKELEIARREVVHSFITRFAVPREIVSNRMTYDLQGYPEDFIDTFVDRVRAVTAVDAAEAARAAIQPGRIRILVVGNPEEMDCSLSDMGDVTTRTLDTGGGER